MSVTTKITRDGKSQWNIDQGLDRIGVVQRYDWPADSRHAGTPFELWTPSYKSGQGVPRFATLEKAVTAAEEAAKDRARTSTLEAHVVHRETYRGTEIVVTRVPARMHGSWYRVAHHTLELNGRSENCPAGYIEDAVVKIRKVVDVRIENAEMAAELATLTDARPSVAGMPGWDDGAAPKVGDVAYVYGHGMFRRGRVVEVVKTRATVAYVTATSPDTVHRKADRFAELAAG